MLSTAPAPPDTPQTSHDYREPRSFMRVLFMTLPLGLLFFGLFPGLGPMFRPSVHDR